MWYVYVLEELEIASYVGGSALFSAKLNHKLVVEELGYLEVIS